MSTIHGVPVSPFVRKLMIFMDEKALPYALNMVSPGDTSADFRALSPLGKVPGYSDDQVGISDSSVICAYLEKRHPDPPLYPSDAASLARTLWLEEYADTRFMEASGALYFQTCLAEKFFGRPADQERIAQVSGQLLPDALEYIESVLNPTDFAAAATFGLADCALASNLINLEHAGFAPTAEQHPKLAAYRDRLFERSSVQAALTRERSIFGRS